MLERYASALRIPADTLPLPSRFARLTLSASSMTRTRRMGAANLKGAPSLGLGGRLMLGVYLQITLPSVSIQTRAPHGNGLCGRFTTLDGPHISISWHGVDPL